MNIFVVIARIIFTINPPKILISAIFFIPKVIFSLTLTLPIFVTSIYLYYALQTIWICLYVYLRCVIPSSALDVQRISRPIKLPKYRPVKRLSCKPTVMFPTFSHIPVRMSSPGFLSNRKRSDLLAQYRRWREGMVDPDRPSKIPLSLGFRWAEKPLR